MQLMVAPANGREREYRNSTQWANLALTKLQSLHDTLGPTRTESYIRDELFQAEMLKPECKARYLTRAITNRNIISANGQFVLINDISEYWEVGNNILEQHAHEENARDWVKRQVSGFGYKSASDFLIATGFARYLIAFDLWVVKILEFLGLQGLDVRILQREPSQYKELEHFLLEICILNEFTLAEIDRIFYQKRAEILRQT